MLHECVIEKRKDEFSVKEQYLIRCRCHMEAFLTWQPGDPEFVCPKEHSQHEE